MHATNLISLLASALSVAAFQITSPSSSTSWTITGTNKLEWDRVSTDPSNFTVVLTNTDRSVMPSNNQVLAALVDATSATSTDIQPPSGGFNAGGTYRVNLVKSQDELSTIYAQSDEFEIVAASSSASSSSGSSTSTSAGTKTTANSNSGSSATASDSSASTSTSSGAGVSAPVQLGFMGAALALGAVFA